MASISRAIDTPVHLQWDPSSRLPYPDPGSAPNNCGPTTVVNIAHFYRDASFSIYDTRRLVVADWRRGTSVNEQAEMLRKRGVPCFIAQPSLFAIHNYIGSGRRPILLGLDYSKVPYSIAGHNFRGKHAVEILETEWKNYGRSRGVLLRDPNFNRTYRQDPTGGQRWYPDWVIDAAFTGEMWAAIPERVKEITHWQGRIRVAGPGSRIRESAKEISGNVFGIARTDGYTYTPKDRRLWTNAYLYWWDGEVVKDDGGNGYYKVKTHGGDTKFIRVGAAVVVRKV